MTVSPRGFATRTFQALGNRNYRLFFAGQLISLSGSWLQTTAQAWLILELTHSPLMLGLLVTVQFLPNLVLQPLGGLVADRLSKREVLIATQSCFAVVAAVLGITVGLGIARPWEVFLVVALFGLINVVDSPTRQAFVTEMVGAPRMANAIALNSMVFNGARAVGPALAGILIATVGTALCFDLNAVSYLAVIVGLWLMRPQELHRPARPTGARPPIVHQLREGIAYVRRTPQLALVITLMAVVSTFSYNLTLMITAFDRDGLHAGATGLGILTSALGVGALVGALGVAYLGRPSFRALLLGCAVFGLFLALAGQSPSLPLAALLLAGAGLGMIVFSAMCNSVIQTHTPARLRGRVMALYIWVFLGSTPIGSPLFGAIEQAWGSRLSLLLAGAVALLAALVAAVWRSRHQVSAAPYPAVSPGVAASEVPST
ncbi:MAG: MFS transporter [Candidatus Dormibacteria bacterium]